MQEKNLCSPGRRGWFLKKLWPRVKRKNLVLSTLCKKIEKLTCPRDLFLAVKKTAPAAQAHFSSVSSSSERIWLSSYQPTRSVCQSKEARKALAILRYFGKWSEAFVHPSRVRDWSGFGNDETSFRPDGCLQDFSRIGLDCELPEKFQISRVHPPFTA